MSTYTDRVEDDTSEWCESTSSDACEAAARSEGGGDCHTSRGTWAVATMSTSTYRVDDATGEGCESTTSDACGAASPPHTCTRTRTHMRQLSGCEALYDGIASGSSCLHVKAEGGAL